MGGGGGGRGEGWEEMWEGEEGMRDGRRKEESERVGWEEERGG